MATLIIDQITLGEKAKCIVDSDPSVGGLAATLGTEAIWDNGTTAKMYLKTSASNTGWDLISTSAGAGSVNSGTASRLAIYAATGNALSDTYVQNTQNINIDIVAQPLRTAAITYNIPNPGNAVASADFVLTQGDQVISGIKSFANDVFVSGNLSVSGTMTYVNSSTTDIANKAITLNLGGAAASGSAVGFNISEGAVAATVTLTNTGNTTAVFTAVPAGIAGNGKSITFTNSTAGGLRLVSDIANSIIVDLGGVASVAPAAFNALGAIGITMISGSVTVAEVARTLTGGTEGITGSFLTSSTRNGFTFLAPSSAFSETLRLSNLSASQILDVPNASGAIVIQASTPAGVAGQVSFWNSATTLTNPTGTTTNSLFWDSTNFRLGIGNTAPSVALHVTGSARVTGLSTVGIVHNDATGLLSTSAVSLTADISGILPLANGGSNANLTATAGGIVYSGASALAITAAGTAGQAILSGGTASPTFFSGTGIVHATSGVLSASAVSLTADISGILPIANGGTNSSTALTGKQLMVSNSGGTAIVEAGIMTNGQLLIGSTGAQPVIATLTAGTNAGVSIVNAAGSITLSTVQDIRTTASPSFLAATLIGAGASFDLNDTTAAMDSKITMATVNTTDATLTTIATIAVATGTVALLEAKITGLRTGGTGGTAGDSCTYIRTARIKNIAGTAALMNLQADYTSEDQTAFNGTISVSAGNALVQVQGAVNNNMTWKVQITKIV